MKCRFFLNSIIWQCLSFFKLFSCKNQSLLIWWNSFFFLDFCFDCVNWIVWFNFKCDCFSCECFNIWFVFFISLYSIWKFQFLKKWTSSEIHSNHQNLFNSSEQKRVKTITLYFTSTSRIKQLWFSSYKIIHFSLMTYPAIFILGVNRFPESVPQISV